MSAYAPLLPILLLTGISLVAMLMSAMVRDSAKVGWFTAAGLTGVLALSVHQGARSVDRATTLGGMVTVDGFSYFFYVLFALIGIVVAVMSIPHLEREQALRGEYHTLMLFSLLGMFVMVSSDDLMTLFLGLETMSLSVYTLVGWRRHQLRSNEAVLKYFFLGSLAAAVFLYGIALIYGTAGTTNLLQISLGLGAPALATHPMFTLGALLVLAGVGFKVAAFPFHMWVPDVYEGAPAPVTAFMATAVKAAGFALALRFGVAVFAYGQLHDIGQLVVWNLAILTMFAGNFFALAQRNMKRMLAYSGIAHTGYLLVGLAALPVLDQAKGVGTYDAGAAVLFYLVAYAFTNLGALACVAFLSGREERLENISDYAGLGWRYPLVGLGLAVCMFSLIGFPLTAGFLGKYLLFAAALKANMLPLVAVAIVNSILSVYYYLRVVITLFMEPATPGEASPVPGPTKAVIAYAVAAVVWAGFGTFNMTTALPGAVPLIDKAGASIRALLSEATPAGES
jgi:NADH-quinone oxidoreductase subunit N